jgi:hypothetical protein
MNCKGTLKWKKVTKFYSLIISIENILIVFHERDDLITSAKWIVDKYIIAQDNIQFVGQGVSPTYFLSYGVHRT